MSLLGNMVSHLWRIGTPGNSRAIETIDQSPTDFVNRPRLKNIKVQRRCKIDQTLRKKHPNLTGRIFFGG